MSSKQDLQACIDTAISETCIHPNSEAFLHIDYDDIDYVVAKVGDYLSSIDMLDVGLSELSSTSLELKNGSCITFKVKPHTRPSYKEYEEASLDDESSDKTRKQDFKEA